jgi:putative acetyltransferase
MRAESALVRPVTSTDVPDVVALVRAALEEFGFVFGEGSDTDTALLSLPGSYEEAGGAFFVAVLDSTDAASGALGTTLAGTAGIYPVGGGEYELRKMYLAPSARGHGLGTRLLAACIDAARARNATRLVLDTAEAMTAAIALYERTGFVRDDAYCHASRCTRGYRLEL